VYHILPFLLHIQATAINVGYLPDHCQGRCVMLQLFLNFSVKHFNMHSKFVRKIKIIITWSLRISFINCTSTQVLS